MNIYALIIVLVVAVIGASFLGFSVTDFFNDIKKTVDEQTKIANEQGDPKVTTTANTVEDTGTRNCNLKVLLLWILFERLLIYLAQYQFCLTNLDMYNTQLNL